MATKKRKASRKPRTAAQRAATARMLAALRTKRAGGRNPKRKTRKPRMAASRRQLAHLMGVTERRLKPITAAQIKAAHGYESTRAFRAKPTRHTAKGFHVLMDGKKVASFANRTFAFQYARALHRAHKSKTVSVEK